MASVEAPNRLALFQLRGCLQIWWLPSVICLLTPPLPRNFSAAELGWAARVRQAVWFWWAGAPATTTAFVAAPNAGKHGERAAWLAELTDSAALLLLCFWSPSSKLCVLSFTSVTP